MAEASESRDAEDQSDGLESQRFHVDTLDLYQAKARVAFVKQASLELSESEIG